MSGRCITKLATVKIDPNVVDLTADALRKNIKFGNTTSSIPTTLTLASFLACSNILAQ